LSQCLLCSLPDPIKNKAETSIITQSPIADTIDLIVQAGHGPLSEASVRRHRDNHMEAIEETQARLGKIADLITESGISIDSIGKVEKITLGTYQALTKNAEGEAEIHDMERAAVVLSPSWQDGPEWPVVQQAPLTPINLVVNKSKNAQEDGWERAVILPDIQAGFFRDVSGALHPIHDEAAIDVALQTIAVVQPHRIIVVGDGADFAELSRFRGTPAFAQVMQATIDWVERFLAKLRALSPNAIIEWLEGNHEARLQNYILDNAIAAFGLKRANTPESWPVLSFPFLCRFDSHDVRYVGAYPAGEIWVNDRLRVIHGDKVSQNSTAHKYLDEDRVSTVYGHVHRREWAERTRHTREGPRTILAASPGCLCRTDGAVPSTHQGVDLDGIPVTRYENWQNGVMVVEYLPGDSQFALEQVAIHQGWARYRGQEFNARIDIEGNPIDASA
jgi:hypothetical protein